MEAGEFHLERIKKRRIVDLVIAVKQEVKIPVVVKLLPSSRAFGQFARSLDAAGADGLIMLLTQF